MVIKSNKNIKTAPTCFGSRRNNHQGANVSIQLKLQIWFDGSCPYERGQYYGGVLGLTIFVWTSIVEPYL